jgi:hypothetical protein
MLIGGHNLPPELPLSVSIIRTTFEDDRGNHPSASGTGFWINTEDGHLSFATNRHNVDAALAFRDPTFAKWRLGKTEIQLRHNDPEFLAYEPGDFFSAIEPWWIIDDAADAAILVDPSFDFGPNAGRRALSVREDFLADKKWTNENVQMMDECFFIGYPSVKNEAGETVVLYNEWTQFPIARQAIIASDPFYRHKDIKTQGTMLVSGLSFHGSSGSPLIVPFLGLPPGSVSLPSFVDGRTKHTLVVGASREPRIIGIMTGAFFANQKAFTHAGLSYFTHSAYIVKMIERARGAGWQRPATSTGRASATEDLE